MKCARADCKGTKPSERKEDDSFPLTNGKNTKSNEPLWVDKSSLTRNETLSVVAENVGNALKRLENKLSRQVRENWHDGWEAQSETKVDWFLKIRGPLQAVLNVGVKKRAALKE